MLSLGTRRVADRSHVRDRAAMTVKKDGSAHVDDMRQLRQTRNTSMISFVLAARQKPYIQIHDYIVSMIFLARPGTMDLVMYPEEMQIDH